MANYTLRPDNSAAVVLNGGGTTPSAANTVRLNLGDNSDATSVVKSNNNAIQWAFDLTNPTIPTDEFICRVGHSIRLSRASTLPATCGVNTYRTADGYPGWFPTLKLASVASPTNYEVAYSSVTWPRTDAANLRIAWYDSSPSTGTFTTYELFSTLYTIKNSTCVPSATTMTNSAVPAVPVAVTNTIGFEASSYDWQGLRKITVEIRVEANSSTGAGTTPALSTGVYEYNALATGTDTVTVNATTALPNATYKVYARATRHRENETEVLSDQIGAWSTAATLTMSTPLPAAPSLFTATANTATDTVVLSATPFVTGSYTTPMLVDYERSDDGGTTWVPVRDGTGISASPSTAVVLTDYEAPRGITVYYRTRLSATYTGGFLNTSAWSSSVTATIPANKWNLKVPQLPALNYIDLRVVSDPAEDITEDLGVFRPLDRRYPVVVAGKLGGWDGEFTVSTITSAEWSTLKALVEAQRILLLQSPYGWEKYIRIVNGARTLIKGTSTTERRQVTFQYVETGSPA